MSVVRYRLRGNQITVIVDCHTHIWESPDQLGLALLDGAGGALRGDGGRRAGRTIPNASMDQHHLSSAPVDKTFVLGFKSRYLSAEIPGTLISKYVRQHPDKIIGVAGIDPTNLSEAMDDVRQAHDELGLKAITVSPSAQDFHPADSRAMQVFAEAARLRMPVLLDHGIHFSVQSKLEFARPVLLDEVARELPELKLVIAHLGYPWIDECIVLLAKHPNLYADLSALIGRPWQAYHALLSAYQYGVVDKLLFGSDFPYMPAAAAIESLYRINQLVTGTNLPTVPRPLLASIVERESLSVLGIEPALAGSRNEDDSGLLDGREA